MKLLIADDHKIITDGLTPILNSIDGIKKVIVCQNGSEVLQKIEEDKFELILLDIDMPILNGLECAKRILAQYKEQKIAMLTMHSEKALIQKFIELGTKGYFLKTIDKEELKEAVSQIINGKDYFPSEVTKALIAKKAPKISISQSQLLALLSPREIEIIQKVSMGLTNKEIGEQLNISPRTVDTHRTNLMRKIEVKNVAGLVRFAFQNGLME